MKHRIAASILALTMLCMCGCSAFVTEDTVVSESDNVSPTETVVTQPYSTDVHIPGIVLPDEYGDGYLDCEAAFWIINQLREIQHLEPVKRCDQTFLEASLVRMDEVTYCFSHTRPNGTKYATFIVDYDIPYTYSNENLASGQYTAEHVVHDWMVSPAHYANLLDPYIESVCIACSIGEDGLPYWIFEGIRYTPLPDDFVYSVSDTDTNGTNRPAPSA